MSLYQPKVSKLAVIVTLTSDHTSPLPTAKKQSRLTFLDVGDIVEALHGVTVAEHARQCQSGWHASAQEFGIVRHQLLQGVERNAGTLHLKSSIHLLDTIVLDVGVVLSHGQSVRPDLAGISHQKHLKKKHNQNTENWKWENRLFTSTALEAGASGQNRISTHTHWSHWIVWFVLAAQTLVSC